MIRQQNATSSLQPRENRLRITATLLNQWQRIFDCEDYVKESDKDTISYEDKLLDARKKAIEEFRATLTRQPVPINEAMQRGMDFEADVQNGLDEEFSPIIEGGAYQVVVQKKVEVDGIKLNLFGILDWLKAGHIYDAKRVKDYKTQKYRKSHQHPLYLFMVPKSVDFTYLVKSDSNKEPYHHEPYVRENCEDILRTISCFLSWLKANDMWDLYVYYWNEDYIKSRKRSK